MISVIRNIITAYIKIAAKILLLYYACGSQTAKHLVPSNWRKSCSTKYQYKEICSVEKCLFYINVPIKLKLIFI